MLTREPKLDHHEGAACANSPWSISTFAPLSVAVPCLLVFCASYFLFYCQSTFPGVDTKPYPSDLPDHINFARELYHGRLVLPHPGFHVAVIALGTFVGGLSHASVILLSLAVTLQFYFFFWYFRNRGPKGISIYVHILMVLSLLLLGAIHWSGFSQYFYVGHGSPNVWHNPTTILVKVFSLLTIMLFLRSATNPSSRPLTADYLCSLSLLCSTVIKPNFALTFGPVAAIFVVIKYRMRTLHFIRNTIIFSPCLAVLIMQWYLTYDASGGNGIAIDFMAVWSVHSPNPVISVFLALAFPMIVLLGSARKANNPHALLIAWTGTLVGLLQYAFLAETGERFIHGNWSWGYLIFLPFLFLVSVVEFSEQLARKVSGLGLQRKTFKILGCLSFTLHFLSGAIYTCRIFSGLQYY